MKKLIERGKECDRFSLVKIYRYYYYCNWFFEFIENELGKNVCFVSFESKF